ncbi:unnamed protein product, partial [Ectocarpus sp. 12 AP-2014]
AQQQGGVVESAGESYQKFPGSFLWYPIDFGSAQQQGAVVDEAGESRENFPRIFVGFTLVLRVWFSLAQSLTPPHCVLHRASTTKPTLSICELLRLGRRR